MKKAHVLLLLLFATVFTFSQELHQWTEPVAITDSLSYNANPFVWVNYENISLMFYEKLSDSLSTTMIYKTELNGDDSEVQLLANDSFHYRQPKFAGYYSNDMAGYLFFLSDMDGNHELYVTQYMHDGTTGNTIKLTDTEAGIEQYTLPIGSDYLGWISEGSVSTAMLHLQADTVYLENIVQRDSNNCRNIAGGSKTFAWEKLQSEAYEIKGIKYVYNPDSMASVWTDPFTIDVLTHEPQLSMSHTVMELWFRTLNWIRSDSIVAYHIFEDYYEISDSYGIPAPANPASIYWFIAVRNEIEGPCYTCFNTGPGSEAEIFCLYAEFGYHDSTRITHNAVKDFNPVIFSGEETTPAYSEFVYNIWQSERNGKMPLYMSKSKVTVWGNVSENQAELFRLSCSPNPFNDRVIIKFNLPKNIPATCSVRAVSGELIKNIPVDSQPGKRQQLVWEPDEGMPKGIYLITLSQGSIKGTIKAVYQ